MGLLRRDFLKGVMAAMVAPAVPIIRPNLPPPSTKLQPAHTVGQGVFYRAAPNVVIQPGDVVCVDPVTGLAHPVCRERIRPPLGVALAVSVPHGSVFVQVHRPFLPRLRRW